LAPAAGPGWEEPTSQSYRKFLSGSDYVFTPRTSSIGGSAYDGAAFCGRPSCVVTARRNVPRRTAAWAISLRRRYFCALSRYGVIRFDRPSTRWTKTTTRQRQARPMAGLPVAVLRPCIRCLSATRCCRKMFFVRTSVFALHRRRSALGANFVHGCLSPIYRCQLSSEARFRTVDFPRRCPFSGILPCSLPR
jgi:hypothetical protein